MWYFIIFGIAVILLNIYIWVVYKKTEFENFDNNAEIDKQQGQIRGRINGLNGKKQETIQKENDLKNNFSKEQTLKHLNNIKNDYSTQIKNLEKDIEYWEKQRVRSNSSKTSKKANEPTIMNLDKCKDEFFITTRNEIQNTLLMSTNNEQKIRTLNNIKDGQPYKNCIYGNASFKGLLDILSDDNEPPDYSDQVRQIKDWNYNTFTLNSNSILKEVKALNPINTTEESQAALDILKNYDNSSGDKIKSLVDNNNIR